MRHAGSAIVEPTAMTVAVRARSASGSLSVSVISDGETVLAAAPLLGSAHKGVEKLAEARAYGEVPELVAAADPVAPLHAQAAFLSALERLCDVSVPPKAEWLRSLVLEVERAASHTRWLASWMLEAGRSDAAGAALQQRARLTGVLEELTGAPRGAAYVRFGGVAAELAIVAADEVTKALVAFETSVDEVEATFRAGGLLERRLRGLGVSLRDDATFLGVTGPDLRATGAPADVRRFAPYAAYREVSFGVPLGVAGDCWDRCMVRLEEMRWSARTARDLIDGMPSGAHLADEVPACPPPGEAYSSVESPRGEFGVHLVSDGSERPYRLRLRAPSFYNLGGALGALKGVLLDDAPLVLASFDLVACEVER